MGDKQTASVAGGSPRGQALRYFHVDAFTDELFRGNPAGVVLGAEGLPDEVLQKIAAENRLSETAFVLALRQSGSDASTPEGYRLRWFTPTTEIDLCGHATLAAAFVLFALDYVQSAKQTAASARADLPTVDEMARAAAATDHKPASVQFHTRSGRLTVTAAAGLLTLDFPAVEYRPGTESDIDTFTACLGAPVSEIYTCALPGSHVRGKWLAVLKDADTLLKLDLDMERLSLAAAHSLTVTAPARPPERDLGAWIQRRQSLGEGDLVALVAGVDVALPLAMLVQALPQEVLAKSPEADVGEGAPAGAESALMGKTCSLPLRLLMPSLLAGGHVWLKVRDVAGNLPPGILGPAEEQEAHGGLAVILPREAVLSHFPELLPDETLDLIHDASAADEPAPFPPPQRETAPPTSQHRSDDGASAPASGVASAPGILTAGWEPDFYSRFFAPALGIPEDPVTGSSHCVLTPFWARRYFTNRLRGEQLSPRGGRLWCTLVRGRRVQIAGRARLYMSGWIHLPQKPSSPA